MLKKTEILVSEDFPEYEVEIRRPGTGDWSDFQDACVAGNVQEGMLNLLIACGAVHALGADGKRVVGAAVPKIGELADEWSTLPEFAGGTAGQLAGVFGEGINATRLDLQGILDGSARVAMADAGVAGKVENLSDADLALAKLAERCASYGLTADLMRVTIASHPRRGSYVAYLVDYIGAFVFERPRFAAWAAFDRRQRRERLAACVDLVTTCTAFPDRGALAAMIGDLPGFVTSAADEIRKLRLNVRQDVKKG